MTKKTLQERLDAENGRLSEWTNWYQKRINEGVVSAIIVLAAIVIFALIIYIDSKVAGVILGVWAVVLVYRICLKYLCHKLAEKKIERMKYAIMMREGKNDE